MILQQLTISNFRCFKKFDIDFSPGFNILIGRNGAGKSTLLHAIQKALSFMFSNDRSVSDFFLSAGINDLNIRSYEPTDFNYDTDTRQNALYASIRSIGKFENNPIDWTMYRRNAPNASLYPSKYKEAFNIVMSTINSGADYPLIAYYSDSYPHKDVKQMKHALEIIKRDVMPRNFGYYQWDDESSCTSIWEKRLSSRLAKMLPLYTPASRLASEELSLSEQPETEERETKLAEIHKRQDEINAQFNPLHHETDYIERKLKEFAALLPKAEGENFDIDYLSVSDYDNNYHLTINYTNGQSSPFSDLPAGYRRLYSIVLDLAYRSYILNDYSSPKGIVIIDEIDLHLHPSLEGSVVNALKECFPLIQFIVSTHSVAVISNLPSANEDPNNQIYVLKDNESQPEMLRNLNGIDYDIVLRDFMDAYSRNNDVKKLIDECLTFYSYGMTEEAKTIYAQIIDKVGTDSPVIRELNDKINNYNREGK